MSDKKNEINKSADPSNIFDDFGQSSNLVKEVDNLKNENNKDKFYYLSKTAHFLQTVFLILIFVLIILFSYIYVQNKDDLNNSNFLDPLCYVFIGDIKTNDSLCSSISYLNINYKKELLDLQKSQTTSIIDILEKLYEVENFTKTKEVLFLLDKSKNKLKVLKILEEFDNIKNEFDNLDKEKIQCSWLSIEASKNLLTMNCEAYSSTFESIDKWFDWESDKYIKGTSISIANSFLNFISKKSEFFTIIDRQKIFRTESVLWQKTNFTNKTNFSLKLKYNLQ